ncbi:MAG TPA: quinone-dependent dihydroorotate dehydrogenase [Allosphingosinicella sp.]|nr:quinone-dependent dihydroorotate dehydrogenase [Allosphingosinicella sp.]
MVYPLLRPLIFMLDAERAHGLTIAALKLMPGSSGPATDRRLAVRVAGLDFPNPVGLAAGFDKNAEVYRQVLELGFGFAEVGTITPRPQPGNPKPRLFRLAEDRAVINRMGFNNEGLEAARRRLAKRNRARGMVGINVGANKDSSDRVADYAAGVKAMAPLADYLTVNISSPNTPGLRALQDRGALDELLAAVMDARGADRPPIFLKVAPDLERQDIEDIAALSIERGVDALIVSNTTVSRPDLVSRHRSESGGLSGAPLKRLALERLRDFRRATGGAIPLIAAGGIENGVDAYHRIKAGASLVQLYSALVYQGPGLARMIAGELRSLLVRDGFSNIVQAIGAEEP